MSIPFLISQRPSTSVIFSNNTGDKFLARIFLDVASVNDGEPLKSDNSPQFEVSFQSTAIITPSSSRNLCSNLPVKFLPRLTIQANSSLNGKTYEMPFEASVESIRMSDTVNPIDGMPIITVDLYMSPIPIQLVEDQIIASFYCVYCRCHHPGEWYTDEHIIPEALNNKNYVLPAACRRVNNYMSHAFEKRILQFEVIKEINLMISPPKKPVFRANFNTDSGANISRWILPSGLNEIVENPQFSEDNQVLLIIKGQSGEEHSHRLILPFMVMKKVTGAPRMLRDRQRYAERAKKQIEDYLIKISNDPTSNPEFDKFLKDIGGKFNFKEVLIEEKQTQNPPNTTIHELKQTVNIDNEALFKLFIKIAWTHTCKQLGEKLLHGDLAQWLLTYLTTGHFEDIDLIIKYPSLFTKPTKIEGHEFVFWKHGLDETFNLIMGVKDDTDRNDLLRHFKCRAQRFEFSRQFIEFKAINEINDDIRSRRNEFSFHNLSLLSISNFENTVTACLIKLFGGIFEVKVQISQEPLCEIYPPDIRIEF